MSQADDFEPVSRTHVSQGLKLNYLDWGNEGAPVLLLVHGSRDHARSWDWAARALRSDWRVIAPDLRGHGDSDWSADGGYISSYHLLDLADLIDHLGAEQVTLVGHSFGGNISARYAAAFPERVKKLVLVDAIGITPAVTAAWEREGPAKRTRDWVEKRRTAGAAAARRLKTLDEAVARMAAANPHLSDAQVRHLAVHGVRQHPDGYAWKYDPLVSVFAPEDFSMENGATWSKVTAPTLICHGRGSFNSHPEEDGRAANFADHRTLVFEDAGHWVHHDQLDAFLGALREFL